ncbi:MAG: 5'-nucleotidase C-terminal domain-containing protein [Acidobacteriota bacterium]
MRAHAAPIAIVALLAAMYLYPISVLPGRFLVSAEDTAVTLWGLCWGARQLVLDPAHLYDGNLFAPHPKSFAYNDASLGDAPFSVPIYWITGSPVVTYNVSLLLVFFLTCAATYALAFDMTRHRGGALFAAVAFGFCSPRSWYMDAMNASSVQWMPLALYCLRRCLAPGARPYRAAIAFAVLAALTAMCSWYSAFMLAVAAPFFVLPEARALRGRTGPLAIGALLAAVLTVPHARPYLWLHEHEPGFVRERKEVAAGSARLSDYLGWDYASTLYRASRRFELDAPFQNGPEPAFPHKLFARPLPFFPGVFVALFALVGLARGTSSRGLRVSLLLLGFAAIVLSLGPSQRWFGRDVTLPYAFLYDHVPGWKGIRWVARFSLLFTLAIALLAASGVAAMVRTAALAGRHRLGQALALGATLATFCEKLTLPLHLTAVPSTPPPVYDFVRALPDDAIFLEIPFSQEGLYTYWAAFHWKRTAGGQSGWAPEEARKLRSAASIFPSRELWERLRASRVRYLIVHYHFLNPPRPGLEAEASASAYFDEVKRYGEDVVYEVRATPREERSFAVVAVNDVYRIEGVEGGRIGGLGRLRTLRAEVERQHPGSLLVHAGDFLFPSLLSRSYKGEQMIDILNLLDGDPERFDEAMIVTFGNHEFEKGKLADAAMLDARIEASQFTWLGSNVAFASGPGGEPLVAAPNLKDHTVIASGGVKVGLFSLTTHVTMPEYVTGFADPISRAREETSTLRGEGAEVVVAVTHQEVAEDVALLKALGSDGPDLILGGHDHEAHAEEVGGRWVLKADADARTATVAIVTPHRGAPPGLDRTLVALGPDRAEDPAVAARVTSWIERHDAEYCKAIGRPPGCLSDRIGYTRTRLGGEEMRIRRFETSLGDWVADRMLDAFKDRGAQIAFVNSGGLRLNQDIPEGSPVTLRHIEELIAFPAPLRLIRIDGRTLQAVLTHSVEDWSGNGWWLQVGGLAFRHHPATSSVSDLTLLGPAARPIAPDEEILAVTVDFLMDPAHGQDGYAMLKPSMVVATGPDLKDVLRAALARAGDAGIAPVVEGRICNDSEAAPCLVR